jgi:YidC/Oxa1 family membrane protein insertase
MEEQKNLLIAVLLCVVVWLGMEVWLKPARPPQIAETPPQAASVCVASQPLISREEAFLQSPRIAIQTPLVKGSINLKGGMIDDWTLRDYRKNWRPDSHPVTLFSPDRTQEAYYSLFQWYSSDTEVPGPHTVWQPSGTELSTDKPLTLQWRNEQGVLFQQILSLDFPYVLTVKQEMINTTEKPVTVSAGANICRHGPVKTSGYLVLHEGPLGVFDGQLKETTYSDVLKGKMNTFENLGKNRNGWEGITGQYFLSALIAQGQAKGRFIGSDNPLVYSTELRHVSKYLLPHEKYTTVTHLFAGPKQLSLLDHYEKIFNISHFDLAVDFGWFYFLTKPMFYFLSWLKKLGGSFGFAIIAMTVLIKALFFPLSVKSYRSMARIKKLQPKLQALKDKYAQDKMRLNQEIMAFYKKEKINPVSGCLPMLVQIPVFFSLYKVLFISIEMRQAPFWGWIHDLAAPDPTNIFNIFGLLPWHLPAWLKIGAWPIIMGITMVGQQLMNSSMTLDKQQKMMFTYVMPCVFTFMLAQFPVGLVIYWTWSNTLTIAQQWIMTRYYESDRN